MPWGWIALAFGALAVWVLVRWVLRATAGLTAARDRAYDALRELVPGAETIGRGPGTFLLLAGDDRVELDYAAVVGVALKRPDDEALLAGIRAVVDAAFAEQTDPEQLAEERAEARDVLGPVADDLPDGALSRALFGFEDDDERAASIAAALAESAAGPGHEPAPAPVEAPA